MIRRRHGKEARTAAEIFEGAANGLVAKKRRSAKKWRTARVRPNVRLFYFCAAGAILLVDAVVLSGSSHAQDPVTINMSPTLCWLRRRRRRRRRRYHAARIRPCDADQIGACANHHNGAEYRIRPPSAAIDFSSAASSGNYSLPLTSSLLWKHVCRLGGMRFVAVLLSPSKLADSTWTYHPIPRLFSCFRLISIDCRFGGTTLHPPHPTASLFNSCQLVNDR